MTQLRTTAACVTAALALSGFAAAPALAGPLDGLRDRRIVEPMDPDGEFPQRPRLPRPGPAPAPAPLPAPAPVPAENCGADTSCLTVGQVLGAGTQLVSTNGAYRLVMQTDGNLVEYTSQGRALWSTNTASGHASVASLRPDGRLLVTRVGGAVAFDSRSPGAVLLRLRTDGNLVLEQPGGTVVWQNQAHIAASLPPPAPRPAPAPRRAPRPILGQPNPPAQATFTGQARSQTASWAEQAAWRWALMLASQGGYSQYQCTGSAHTYTDRDLLGGLWWDTTVTLTCRR